MDLGVTKNRLLSCLDGGPVDIGTLWEICAHFEWEMREKTVDGIATWLGPPDGMTVLDCACGSGFPALDLARRGYDIACSDGSEIMLAHFRRNAAVAGVDLEPAQVLWDDLTAHYREPFDVVMCRGGGSFLYAGTWDHDAPPDPGALMDVFGQFVACVRPGGRLYVDIMHADDLARVGPLEVRHPTLTVGSHTIDLTEVTTNHPDRGIRTWHSTLVLDGEPYEFDRRSQYLRHDELAAMLADAGLADVRAEAVPGEHYQVFTGRRPNR